MNSITILTAPLKKLLATLMIILFCLQMLSPISTSHLGVENKTNDTPLDTGEQELHLLRVEHFLYLNASENLEVFHVLFSFPPDYGYQVPILLELYNDSTLSRIIHYSIQNDVLPPNKIINFTLGPLNQSDSILLHFSCWVLVKNHDFTDLPVYVKIPRRGQVPEEYKIWLSRTEQVQVHSLLINSKARQLRGLSDNLVRYAHRISLFIKYHRYLLFVIGLNTGLLLAQDARTTLLFNGENVGRSHLACAFFRTQNIPARVLLANNDQEFWTQMHYMVEYFCPGYGWVLLDPTFGKTPYPTYHQVINRVCYPQDEQDTKRDYIFPFMKGEERWLWIDNESVVPYYVDCDLGSKSRMFSEAKVAADEVVTSYAFVLTQFVFRMYQGFLGMNLTQGNQQCLENAIQYQKQAIHELHQSLNLEGYISYMNRAYDEYQKIEI